MEARWWTSVAEKTVVCNLCFRQCTLEPKATGLCSVRSNEDGKLISPFLGRFVSAAVDPIEKKPLYRWRSGTFIFSVGSFGCTMRCLFCQNANIAQPKRSMPTDYTDYMGKEDILRLIKKQKLDSIAYTYNEPTLQAEYILDAAPLFQDNGISTVLVTNGMMSQEVAELLIPKVAAANIDLKTFSAKNYARLGGRLDNVKRNIKAFWNGGVHLETTCLLVPGISDSEEDFVSMCDWLAEISKEIVLHISRYFPAHKYFEPATDRKLMERFEKIAKARLKYVYLGNLR